MSLDYDFLAGGGTPSPAPPAPIPPTPPAPAPPPDGGWPADDGIAINRGLAALNQRRKERGVGPLALDAPLCRAAKVLAVPLGVGQAAAHDGFDKRVRDEGWARANCGIRNSSWGNVSEGIAWGGRTPEDTILILDDYPDPNEGHRQDFEDPAFTHVGIAYARNAGGEFARYGGYAVVVDYGADCARKPQPGPTPAPAPGPVSSPTPDPLQQQMLDAHNAIRKAHGLSPLGLNANLVQAALFESMDCAKSGRLSHTSSDGATPFQRMARFGYKYTWAAENIAWNQQTIDDVMKTWMGSPGHRANILGPHYREAGFASIKDGRGGVWWTADFGATAANAFATAAMPFEHYDVNFFASAYRSA